MTDNNGGNGSGGSGNRPTFTKGPSNSEPQDSNKQWWRRKRFNIPIGVMAALIAIGSLGSHSDKTENVKLTTDSHDVTTSPVVAAEASTVTTAAPTTIAPVVTTASPATAAPQTTTTPSTTTTKAPVATTAPTASVYYANCTAARSAGATPIYRGQPGYAAHLDRDNDGIACE